MMSQYLKLGTYTGTGAAQTITTGFKPNCILAVNQTDGDTFWIFINGMTAATSVSFDAEVAIETSACTLTDTGFTLGTNAVINENTDTYVYIAF